MTTIHAIVIYTLLCVNACQPFSLMLDPAGDAKNCGRIVHNNFERGVSLQFTENLKKKIEETVPNLRVILTRFPGETIEPLQNANFANRLNVDLYVSIHFYQESNTRPQMHLYYVSYNDQFLTKTYDLCLYPYDQAHRINSKKTATIIQQCDTILGSKQYARYYDYKGSYGLPFKPLIGIQAPSIGIEISLKNSTDWQTYIEPITLALKTIIESYE